MEDGKSCATEIVALTDEDNAWLSVVRQIVCVRADRLPDPIAIGQALLALHAVGLLETKQHQ
jgi:hypothetical protein